MDSNSSKPRFSRSRIIRFLSVVSATLLAATWFVCATWNHFWKIAPVPVWQIMFPALTLLFIATTILARRYSILWLRLGYRISAIWLGVLNNTFFASGAAWIFSAAAAMVSFHIEPKIIAATFFGGAMLTGIYGLVNACWLRAARVTVKLANLPANWRGGTQLQGHAFLLGVRSNLPSSGSTIARGPTTLLCCCPRPSIVLTLTASTASCASNYTATNKICGDI